VQVFDQEIASAGSRAQEFDDLLTSDRVDRATLRRGAYARALALLFRGLFGHRPIFYPVVTGRSFRTPPAPEALVEDACNRQRSRELA
jgi:hypothetical protein